MKRSWVLALLVSAALMGAVLTWNAVRQEREFRRLIAAGDAALAGDQTYVAIEAFSGALALKPESMLGYLKRGDTYRRRGELTAALRDLRQAAALDPTATRAWELLGDVNASLQRFERAAEDYRRFVALDDRSPRVLYKLALAHYRNGQIGAAVEPLRQAVSFDERFSEAHHLLGLCFRDRKRDKEALRSLLRAVEISPAFSAARADLADLYAALGRNRESIEQLEALAAIEPARPERLVSVGLAYARLGRTDAAILTLGRAAERYPEEPRVYTALGRVWLDSAIARSDRVALRKAVEALEPPATRENADSETLALYGRALFLAGHTEAAERALQQAVTRLPVDPSTFLYLSAAAERLGDRNGARAALDAYTLLREDESDDGPGQVAGLLVQQRRLRFATPAARRSGVARAIQ